VQPFFRRNEGSSEKKNRLRIKLPPLSEIPPAFPHRSLVSYPEVMNHLQVLQEKIVALRAEIAQIQELNQEYRRNGRREAHAQAAHGQRHERLQEIQQELSKLADLGRRVRSIEEMKEEHRARLRDKGTNVDKAPNPENS
jgi:DNA repair exonuclease SbcCD ATPase subunit